MMMCTRCKKRPAVVFVSPSTDMNATQGYCLVCAKELGIKPVNDIMEKMGITEEQLEAMTESMNDLMSMSDDGSFEPGGAVPFPSGVLHRPHHEGEKRRAGCHHRPRARD